MKKCIEKSPEELVLRKKRAEKYFAANGINPYTKGNMYQERILDIPPVARWHKQSEGLITYPATVDVISVLFYTHIEVEMVTPDGTWYFEGNSGGLGVGDCTAVGPIYFGSLSVLTNTTTFGVFFGSDPAGAVQVTWGSHGNFTGVCAGEGAGAFGGNGSWNFVKS